MWPLPASTDQPGAIGLDWGDVSEEYLEKESILWWTATRNVQWLNTLSKAIHKHCQSSHPSVLPSVFVFMASSLNHQYSHNCRPHQSFLPRAPKHDLLSLIELGNRICDGHHCVCCHRRHHLFLALTNNVIITVTLPLLSLLLLLKLYQFYNNICNTYYYFLYYY